MLKGRIAPSFPEGIGTLQADTLWIFPPGHPHGWHGEQRQSSRVAVFHFSSVPHPLAELCDGHGYFQKPISGPEKTSLAHLARDAAVEVLGKGPLLEFYSQRVLMDLALIALREEPTLQQAHPDHSAAARVAAALGWYRSMLPARPSVEWMACAAGLSEGHLRRLFQATHHCSPRVMMHTIQLEEASALLAGSSAKLEAVASACGFASAGVLCRAFKKAFGMTPAEFRRRAFATA